MITTKSLLFLFVTLLAKKMVVSAQIKLCQNSGYCRIAADCVLGNTCKIDPYDNKKTVCIADPDTYSKTAGCVKNLGSEGGICSISTQCCDPGAICDVSLASPSCRQPLPKDGTCIDANAFPTQGPSIRPVKTTKPTPSSTYKPTFKPSSIPSTHPTFKPSGIPSKLRPTANPSPVPSKNPSRSHQRLPVSFLSRFRHCLLRYPHP